MNKIVSGIIDSYALHQMHKEKSSKSHFLAGKSQNLNPEDFLSFYQEPLPSAVKLAESAGNLTSHVLKQNKIITNYAVGKYYFESQMKDNGKSNDNVIGIYRRNVDTKDAPNVIFVHGWRMNSIHKIDEIYLKNLMKLGFNMYYFTMPYHLERNSTDSLYNGELMISADVNRTLLSVQQAVSDLRSLIRWIKSTSKGKIILIGVSLGGFLTNLTCTVESDIDAVISVFYANNLAHTIWNTIPGKYIKQDFERNSPFTYSDLNDCWKIITPSSFKPIIPREKILLLSAIYDKYIDINDANELWEEWGYPKRILYKCGHAGIVLMKNEIANDSLKFIKLRANCHIKCTS